GDLVPAHASGDPRVIWEGFVGLRYLRGRRRRTPLSLISLISLAGVSIGVATLLIVLGVMTGMEHDLRDKILGFNPHITVTSYSGPLDEWRDALARVRATEGVVAAGPVVYGQAMIAIGRSVSGVVVRAIDPSNGDVVVDVAEHLTRGSLAALGEPQEVTLPPEEGGGTVTLGALLVGKELARQLGIAVGETVNVISPLGTPGPAGMVPRIKRFVVVGIFDSGMFDYDTTLAYMSLGDAQKFFDLKDSVSALEVRVADIYTASRIARRVETALGGFPYRARDWMEANRNLFSALKLQTVVSGIVLCLIVVVAAFNILATLTMVVKEKRRDIAILKSMGASSRAIARVFVLKGAFIGVTGTVTGTLLGLAGCWILRRYQFVELPKDVFLFDTLPVDVNPVNFVIVGTVSIAICVLAALSPARRAASLVPVEVIRYE
ncbi:MAG: ABC transporter permease, partial [Actinobacteria bacterium]|nr:ABC transporter permease [Actinomycetota bacterium]